jgi:hypothetical protein
MAIKRTKLACARSNHTYVVLQVGPNKYDSFAARTVKQAKDLAIPDQEDTVTMFKVCAKDAGEARTLHGAGKSIRVRQVQRGKR